MRFRPRIRSRHQTHDVLRSNNRRFQKFPIRSVIRLGSTTENEIVFPTSNYDFVEINTVHSVRTCIDKKLMKEAFDRVGAKTAIWGTISIEDGVILLNSVTDDVTYSKDEIPFPLVIKNKFGSRNTGNFKINNYQELEDVLVGKTLSNYIFEKFYTYLREYRLHISKNGCFYTCRKMLKRDTPDEDKWYRNDEHCVWILEENELFDKPSNWNDIVSQCVDSLKEIGLDVGAFDVKIQSAKNGDGEEREYPEFILLEVNSAPSFGELTAEKYITELTNLINDKINEKQ